MSERYSVAGKVALITGSARGIGYATANELHARGAYVVLTDLDEEAVTRPPSRSASAPWASPADVTDTDAMEGAVSKSVESFERLDILIANAGVAPPGASMRHIDPNLFERTVEIDLLGVWRSVRPALPQIVENRGHVVVVSSVYAWVNGDVRRALRREQGRGGGARPRAALGAERDRRLGERRALRLHRHRDGAPGLRHRRPPHREVRRDLPGVHAQAPAAERGRARGRRRDREARARASSSRAGGACGSRCAGCSTRSSIARWSARSSTSRSCARPTTPAAPSGQEGLTRPASADDVAEAAESR